MIFKKKKVFENKMCVLIISTTFVSNISHSENNWTRCDQKCISVCMYSTGYCCQILTKLEFSRQIFEKYSNNRFHENPPSGNRVVPCGRTDERTDRGIDMTTLIVAFRSSANASKNCTFCPHTVFMCSVWISEQTAIISQYNINWLVCITETKCVYCAVRTGSLNVTQINPSLLIVFLCFKQTLRWFPRFSCYCLLLFQLSLIKFAKINPLAWK
jgi:hypothetical protein